MNTLAFFDLDKTLYDGYSMVDFLFGYAIPRGLIQKEDKAMAEALLADYSQGLITYGQATAEAVRLSGKVVAGHTVLEVKQWQEEFFQTQKLFSYVSELFSFLKKSGFEVYIVSASIEPIVTHIAKYLGVKSFASTIEIKNGVYTQRVTKILDEAAKSKEIAHLLKRQQNSVSFGFGDSSGDEALLDAVTHGFLYEPAQDELKKLAESHGWSLVTRNTILETVRQRVD